MLYLTTTAVLFWSLSTFFLMHFEEMADLIVNLTPDPGFFHKFRNQKPKLQFYFKSFQNNVNNPLILEDRNKSAGTGRMSHTNW